MRCTRCGNEMVVKQVETGKDAKGNPVYAEYAFCYHCKIKMNLEKQKKNRPAPEETKEQKAPKESKEPGRQKSAKRKKKRGVGNPLNILPKGSGKKKKRRSGDKKGHGFLKFLITLLILAAIGAAAYYNRETLKKWAGIGLEKFDQMSDQKENDQADPKTTPDTSGDEKTTDDADTNGTGGAGTDGSDTAGTGNADTGTGSTDAGTGSTTDGNTDAGTDQPQSE